MRHFPAPTLMSWLPKEKAGLQYTIREVPWSSEARGPLHMLFLLPRTPIPSPIAYLPIILQGTN